MKNLFRLLQIGQERVEQEMREHPELRGRGSEYIAWRTWVRMVMSCQKRVHKPMQEMVAYLLGVPEAWCTHEFRVLYYTNLVHLAEEALPRSGANIGMPFVPPNEDITVVPPQEGVEATLALHAGAHTTGAAREQVEEHVDGMDTSVAIEYQQHR